MIYSSNHTKSNILLSREVILKRIDFLSFKIWELDCYLKINPSDKKAIEILEKYEIMRCKLKQSLYFY